MKLIKLARRLPRLIIGGLLAGLLAASFTVLPATPADAADQYLDDFSLSADLSYQESFYKGERKDFSEEYETEDSNKICEKLKSESQQRLKKHEKEFKRDLGIINRKVNDCRFKGSLFFIDMSGKFDEELLKKATSRYALKIKNKNELEFNEYIPYSGQSSDLDKIAKRENLGIARYTFPGKIKSVTPNIGKISGNTWTLDKPLTSAERGKLERINGKITITAERYGSKLGLILGITIPAVLIIAAVIVLLIVRSKRKKKQQILSPYPAGYGSYPPSPYMPGHSGQAVQSPIPGSPNPSGTPHKPNGQPPVLGNAHPPMPGGSPQGGYPHQYGHFPPASYPPNAPQGQPGAPAQGGYYPYPHPYPPANPQNPAGGPPPMPNQGYGAPAPGFPPPQTPPRPPHPGAAAASEPPEQPGMPKHAAYSPQPGQSDKPNSPKHAADPGQADQAGPA